MARQRDAYEKRMSRDLDAVSSQARDKNADRGVNPLKLSSLIGLRNEKAKAEIAIAACRNSGKIFPHTLLYGIGGTGKTAFARAIGDELKYYWVEVEGVVFQRRETLVECLRDYTAAAAKQGHPLLLFIDEIHRLPAKIQEVLYIPMTEWKITSPEGDILLRPFTLFAATTRFDMLDANSFITRFPNQWEIDRYELGEITEIVAAAFRKMQLGFNFDVTTAVAKRCLGIPRIAMNLAEKIQMTVLALGGTEVTLAEVGKTFQLEEIDEMGLFPVHRGYLKILAESMVNGAHVPIGAAPIAAKMGQPEDVIKGAVEPILLQLSLVSPTPRGRILTERGRDYLTRTTRPI